MPSNPMIRRRKSPAPSHSDHDPVCPCATSRLAPLALWAALVSVALIAAPAAWAQGPTAGPDAKKGDQKPPPLAEKTKDLEASDGFLRLYPDPERGRLWSELPPPAGER
ncbi:MAG: hypothetical protein MI919_19170, partial [Holophagales bacterium]|nr:hypothetical protein [Holophagales bacterium]